MKGPVGLADKITETHKSSTTTMCLWYKEGLTQGLKCLIHEHVLDLKSIYFIRCTILLKIIALVLRNDIFVKLKLLMDKVIKNTGFLFRSLKILNPPVKPFRD